MRLSNHNGRKSAKGTYSDKHNDRQFNSERDQHIDRNETENNVYWMNCKEVEGREDMTFAELEEEYYKQYFGDYLEIQNEVYVKEGHKNKCKTIEEYRKGVKTSPIETIIELGNKDNKEQITPEILKDLYEKYKKWHESRFYFVRIMDAALHVDEPEAGYRDYNKSL